jgi:glycosyltransferase involved in cell wall biosynthesis
MTTQTLTRPAEPSPALALPEAMPPRTPASQPPGRSLPAGVAVELVIPVYNEERVLAASVRRLHAYMRNTYTFPFRITIADNASTDGTFEIAESLCAELEEVDALYLDEKGRGRALRAAWLRSEADVVGYMDVDLSTDLSALPDLLEPLLQSRADIAIGSRLAPGAQVQRGAKREVISRSYNLLLRATLGATFSDAQCGFKAGRREVIQELLADVSDQGWFFDTELLYLAQEGKLSIHEVPVRWVDDPDSRVDVIATAIEDLRGIMRLRAAARGRRAPASSAGRAERPAGRPQPAGSAGGL